MHASIKSNYDIVLQQILKSSFPFLFITGAAGTGKSTLIQDYTDAIRKQNPRARIVKVASTGLAAENIGGQTIHSYFSFNPKMFQPYSKRLLDDIKNPIEYLIIDEISMVKPDVIDAIHHAFCEWYKNENPFGGVKVRAFGDLGQLSPIYKRNDENAEEYLKKYNLHAPYFFDAKILKDINFSSSCGRKTLNAIFRQKDDPQFANILSRIRMHSFTNQDLEILNSRHNDSLKNVPEDQRTTLFPHKNEVIDLNNRCLEKIQQPLFTFPMEYKFTPNANEEDQRAIQAKTVEHKYPSELKIKSGARVIILDNNLPHYSNGSVGIVKEINVKENVIHVYLTRHKKMVEIRRSTIFFKKYIDDIEVEIGSALQYPLQLGWGLTMHKAQGQTYDEIYIDPNKIWAAGQAYTALSRSRTLEGLHLLNKLKNSVILLDQRVKEWLSIASETDLSDSYSPPMSQATLNFTKHRSVFYEDPAYERERLPEDLRAEFDEDDLSDPDDNLHNLFD